LYEICLQAVKYSSTPVLESVSASASAACFILSHRANSFVFVACRALNFAHCFSQLGEARPSLRDQFTASSKQFTSVASILFDKLPSDMVAAWTLEQRSTSAHHK
jgi:hypothetical protein